MLECMVNHTEQIGFECRLDQDCGFVDYNGKKLLERFEMVIGEGYIPYIPEPHDPEEDNEY